MKIEVSYLGFPSLSDVTFERNANFELELLRNTQAYTAGPKSHVPLQPTVEEGSLIGKESGGKTVYNPFLEQAPIVLWGFTIIDRYK